MQNNLEGYFTAGDDRFNTLPDEVKKFYEAQDPETRNAELDKRYASLWFANRHYGNPNKSPEVYKNYDHYARLRNWKPEEVYQKIFEQYKGMEGMRLKPEFAEATKPKENAALGFVKHTAGTATEQLFGMGASTFEMAGASKVWAVESAKQLVKEGDPTGFTAPIYNKAAEIIGAPVELISLGLSKLGVERPEGGAFGGIESVKRGMRNLGLVLETPVQEEAAEKIANNLFVQIGEQIRKDKSIWGGYGAEEFEQTYGVTEEFANSWIGKGAAVAGSILAQAPFAGMGSTGRARSLISELADYVVGKPVGAGSFLAMGWNEAVTDYERTVLGQALEEVDMKNDKLTEYRLQQEEAEARGETWFKPDEQLQLEAELEQAGSEDFSKDFFTAPETLTPEQKIEAFKVAAIYAPVSSILERGFGFERVVQKYMKGTPRLTSGAITKTVAKDAAVSGVGGGFEESSQGFVMDLLAEAYYDPERGTWTQEGAKRRAIEFILGVVGEGTMGGAFSLAGNVDARREVIRKLVAKDGTPLGFEEMTGSLRRVHTDKQLLALGEQLGMGDTILNAANGDRDAYEAYRGQILEVLPDTEVIAGDVTITGQVVFGHKGKTYVYDPLKGSFEVDPKSIDRNAIEHATETLRDYEAHEKAVKEGADKGSYPIPIVVSMPTDMGGGASVAGMVKAPKIETYGEQFIVINPDPDSKEVLGTFESREEALRFSFDWQTKQADNWAPSTAAMVSFNPSEEQTFEQFAGDSFYDKIERGEMTREQALASARASAGRNAANMTEDELLQQITIGRSELTLKGFESLTWVLAPVRPANGVLTAANQAAREAVLGKTVEQAKQSMAMAVNHIATGGSVLTVTEEKSESWLKILSYRDGARDGKLSDAVRAMIMNWRTSWNVATGNDESEEGNSDTELIEWFSSRANEYVVSSYELEDASAEREMMPMEVHGFFMVLRRFASHVFKAAQKMVELRRRGALPQDFENAIRTSLGFDNSYTHRDITALRAAGFDVAGEQEGTGATDGAEETFSTAYDLTGSPAILEYEGEKGKEIEPFNYDELHYELTKPARERLDSAIDSGAVRAAVNRLVEEVNKMLKYEGVAEGKGWYGRMRKRLKEVHGDMHRLFTHLLGATSAQTPVDENFKQSVDIIDRYKSGEFDRHIKLYIEVRQLLESGKLVETMVRRRILKRSEAEAMTPAALVKAWTNRYDILPKRRNGKLYNANSGAVLKALSGYWLEGKITPKTPQFAMNLNGESLEATIDVWAARTLRRILWGNENRILPSDEEGVNEEDFALGQIIFREAAKELNLDPDDLQAIVWFGEKHIWDENGWTSKIGAKKSSFDDAAEAFYPEGLPERSYEEGSNILHFLAKEALYEFDISTQEWFNQLDPQSKKYKSEKSKRRKHEKDYEAAKQQAGVEEFIQQRRQKNSREELTKGISSARNVGSGQGSGSRIQDGRAGTYQTVEAQAAFESAKERMGTTGNLNEAGYVLPDGTLLDFSGKRQGGSANVRYLDHREIDFEGMKTEEVWSGMEQFLQYGAVRIDAGGLISTNGLRELTPQQEYSIRRIADLNGGVYLDMEDGGRRVSMEINNPKRVIGIMRRFIAGEDVSDAATFQVAPAPNTPEFRNWFGDSKVVDENGEPLVVYHGTNEDFDTFDKTTFGNRTILPIEEGIEQVVEEGFFFTQSREGAEWYAQRDNYSGRVIEVYLSLQNPRIVENFGEYSDKRVQAEIEKAQGEGNDGVILRNVEELHGTEDQFIAFEPNRVKSIYNQRPTDDPRMSFQTTASQEEFFKDSKLRDESGNLITFYRGQKEYVESFEAQMYDGLIFFSTNPQAAGTYPLGERYPAKRLMDNWDELYAKAKEEDKVWEASIDWENFDTKYTHQQQMRIFRSRPTNRLRERKRTEGRQVYPVYINSINPFDPRTDLEDVMDIIPEKHKNQKELEWYRKGAYTYLENPEFVEGLKAKGYDGMWISEDASTGIPDTPFETFASFYPNQAKSVFNQNPTDDPRISFQTATNQLEAGFYSRLENAVVEADFGQTKPKPPMQWKGVIEKWAGGRVSAGGNLFREGINKDELKWSGILEWLDEQEKAKVTLTKEQVLDYIRTLGRVRFVEDVYVKEAPEGFYRDMDGELYPEEEDAAIPENIKGATQWEYHGDKPLVVEGGRDYHEVVMTMPSREQTMSREEAEERYEELNEIFPSERTPEQWEEYHLVKNIAFGTATDPMIYIDKSHFPESMNNVGHYRWNARADITGAEGFFLEELQSQRHQSARKQGYRTPIDGAKVAEEMDENIISMQLELDELYAERAKARESSFALRDQDGATEEEKRLADERLMYYDLDIEKLEEGIKLEKQYQREYREGTRVKYEGSIPDAPFRKSKEWGLQLFKRALRQAVLRGDSWIGFTTGETQNERYDLSRDVETIRYRNDIGAKQGNEIRTEAVRITIVAKDGREIEIRTDYEGEVFSSSNGNIVPEGSYLDEVIGKDLAVRLLRDANKRKPLHEEFEDAYERARVEAGGFMLVEPAEVQALRAKRDEVQREYSGEDLKVGGKGMRGFYDEILPAAVNKYISKWGAKVESGELVVPAEITDEDIMLLSDLGVGNADDRVSPTKKVTFHKIVITDAMRESVTAGQPTFQTITAQKGSGSTQVATTTGTYEKAYDLVFELTGKSDVLDYGAGLGLGADAMRKRGADVETFEPLVDRWSGEEPPTYVFNTQINKRYSGVVNLNVLNVLEPKLREQVLQDIIQKIKPNGVAVIGTRGWKGDVNNAKNFRNAREKNAIWIKKKVKGGGTEEVYQRGFDGDELVEYIRDRLPEGYTVEKKSGIAQTGAIIRAPKDIPSSLTFQVAPAPNTPEFKEWFGDSKVVDENGEPLVMYHGSGTANIEEFFIPEYSGAFGVSGVHFTSSYQEAFDYAAKALGFEDRIGTGEGFLDEEEQLIDSHITEAYIRASEVFSSNYGNAVIAIAKNKEDIKSTDNQRPTEDPRISFQTAGNTHEQDFNDYHGGEEEVDRQVILEEESNRRRDLLDIPELSIERMLQQKRMEEMMSDEPVSDRWYARAYRYSGLSIGSNLRNISLKLFSKVREHQLDGNKLKLRYKAVTQEAQRLYKQLSKADRLTLSTALFNGDVEETKRIAGKVDGLMEELNKVKSAINELRQYAVSHGIEIGKIENYFPRWMKKPEEFLSDVYDLEMRGIFSNAIAQAREDAAKKGTTLDEQDIERIISNVLSGHAQAGRKPANTKARTIETLEEKWVEKYYATPFEAVERYINQMVDEVQRKKFFGKAAVFAGTEMVDYSMKPDGSEVEYKVTKARGKKRRVAIEDSVALMIAQMVEKGEIRESDQKRVADLIKALTSTSIMDSTLQMIRSFGYITTMMNPSVAILQLEDAVTAAFAGRGIPSVRIIAGIFDTDEMSMARDMGVDTFSQDFTDARRGLAGFVEKGFKWSGVSFLGKGGANTTMNAGVRGYQAAARRGKFSDTQERRLTEFFAGDARRITQLKEDLKNGVKSDDVILLGWNILLDYQPLDVSELPQGYQNHGNLRIFYMLKTFMIKRYDVMRRESLREIKLGVEKRDYGRVIHGFQKLMWLYLIWWLGGASMDFIRDWLTGKEPEVGDTIFASSLKVMGFNRYLFYDFSRHGNPAITAAMFLGFPVPWLQQPARDLTDIAQGDFNIGDAETWRVVPIGGSLYYWYYGGGETRQREEEAKERRKRLKDAGINLPN